MTKEKIKRKSRKLRLVKLPEGTEGSVCRIEKTVEREEGSGEELTEEQKKRLRDLKDNWMKRLASEEEDGNGSPVKEGTADTGEPSPLIEEEGGKKERGEKAEGEGETGGMGSRVLATLKSGDETRGGAEATTGGGESTSPVNTKDEGCGDGAEAAEIPVLSSTAKTQDAATEKPAPDPEYLEGLECLRRFVREELDNLAEELNGLVRKRVEGIKGEAEKRIREMEERIRERRGRERE